LSHFVGIAGIGPDSGSKPLGTDGIGFFGYDRVVKSEDITDGTSTTLVVMETICNSGAWTAGGAPTVRGLADGSGAPYLGKNGQWTSRHSFAGINAAFADGSLRILTEKIDPTVLEALATIAGGEAVSLDDLP
jgi:prepilin-type processing-associated H-X9-DG protein